MCGFETQSKREREQERGGAGRQLETGYCVSIDF
jgi:hypothetical protein